MKRAAILLLLCISLAFGQLPKESVAPVPTGGSGGVGDVVGPASATAGCIPKLDATGKILSESSVCEDATDVTITGKNLKIGTTVLNATAGVIVPLAIATSSPISPAATGFYLNNNAGAVTYNLPAITAATVGLQMCFRQAVGKSGAITLQLPASTSMDIDGANGTAAGTLVSGGALGDAACVVGQAVGQYVGYVGKGTWTNN